MKAADLLIGANIAGFLPCWMMALGQMMDGDFLIGLGWLFLACGFAFNVGAWLGYRRAVYERE